MQLPGGITMAKQAAAYAHSAEYRTHSGQPVKPEQSFKPLELCRADLLFDYSTNVDRQTEPTGSAGQVKRPNAAVPILPPGLGMLIRQAHWQRGASRRMTELRHDNAYNATSAATATGKSSC